MYPQQQNQAPGSQPPNMAFMSFDLSNTGEARIPWQLFSESKLERGDPVSTILGENCSDFSGDHCKALRGL